MAAEAILVVLVTAGAAALRFSLPITGAIVLLLVALVVSYRQVIEAFPSGGGAYAVSKAHLGTQASLVAAASLIVDYVLNAAVEEIVDDKRLADRGLVSRGFGEARERIARHDIECTATQITPDNSPSSVLLDTSEPLGGPSKELGIGPYHGADDCAGQDRLSLFLLVGPDLREW